MTLKFIVPPIEEPSQRERRYAYYSTKTGLRTFGRSADRQNSINYQLIARVSVDTPENKALPYYKQERYRSVTADVYVLELVDGEWYTRWKLTKGEKLDHLPWEIEKVEVLTRYGSVTYHDIKYYDDYVKYMKDDAERQTPYYKSVSKVWRKATEAEAREDYVQWRIAIDRERRNFVTYYPGNSAVLDIRS